MPAKKKPAAKKVAKPPAKKVAKPPVTPSLAPKQARVHPSLKAWLSTPGNVVRLQQILADPVFVAACHYVESMVGVTPDDLVGAHAALPEVIVRKAALAAGAKVFATTLAALPNFRPTAANAPLQPWEHIQAPDR